MKKVLYIALAAALAFSCTREEAPAPGEPAGKVLGVTVSGTVPKTKVTLDGENLVWENTDKVALLVGDATSTGDGVADRSDNNSLAVSLETVKNASNEAQPGIFGGEVALGAFSASDLKAVVYPYSASAFYKYESESGKIAVPVGGAPDADGNYTMTQSAPGVLDGKNIALIAEIPAEKIPAVNDNKVEITGLDFRFACSIIRFNIFGVAYGMGAEEVIQSVTVAPDCDQALAGYQVFDQKDSTWSFSGTARKSVTVALESTEGASPVGKPSTAGVLVYMPVLSRGAVTLGTGTKVTIKTNVSSYELPLAETAITLNPGDIRRVSLNLTDVFPDTDPFKWSVDNENWTGEAPAAFTNLYIKGAVNSDALESIKSAIDAQSSAVALDLSQATYSEETFPAIFEGTAETPYTKLSSIAFPLNVTAVAKKAFYYNTALAAASLTNITAYGDSSFFNTALTEVHLDKNVTSLGIRSFYNILTLKEVYFNAADPKLEYFNTSGSSQRVDFYTFAWTGDDENRATHNADLVATIGPDTRIPRYAFINNGNLSKLIFEYNGEGDKRYGNNSFSNCWYLKEVEFKAVPDDTHGVPYFSGSVFSNGGKNVTGDKFITVPVGTGETYLAMTSGNSSSPYYSHGELMRQLAAFGFKIKDTSDTIFENVVLYSADNSSWTPAIPETFTTLYAKGTLTAANLSAIRTAVDAQASAAAVDLSQAEYATATFPAVFGNATADDASQKISGIKFPSNISEIAANAFYNCGDLETVDLTGIVKIGGNSFRATGLVTLTVPATVTEFTGTNAFAYNWKLQEVHYYSPAPNTVNGTAVTNMGTLSCRNTSEVDALPESYSTGLIPLTAYFYEGCVVPSYCFDTNHKLTKVVFKGVPSETGNAWIIRARYLGTIDCRELTTAYTSYNGPNNGQVGVLATGTKQILVPDGKYANFNGGLWQQLATSQGFEIVDPLHTEGGVQYSADNTTWGDTIPESFTRLYVKGNVTADNLASIKTAIDAQADTVALDMSASSYDSSEFPAVFGGSVTGSAGNAGADVIKVAGSQISSMVFPSNITSIAAAAFRSCNKLTSVDLTGIVTINGSAFANTGLTSVTVPSSVTTCASYAFGYCPDLETIYWNSPATNNHVFSWRNAPDAAGNSLDKPQTVTIGAGAAFGTGQCFDTNHKLSKVVFAGDPASVGSGWIIRCTGISTFDLSACTKTNGTSSSNLGSVGDAVPSGTEKVIIVPDALKEDFASTVTWGYLVNNKGFVIKGVSEIQ